ncbi:MAG: hypothetical protein ACK559_29930, partial [bacterium]
PPGGPGQRRRHGHQRRQLQHPGGLDLEAGDRSAHRQLHRCGQPLGPDRPQCRAHGLWPDRHQDD